MKQVIFDGADMYARSGKRRGTPMGKTKDRNGWERTLRTMPRRIPWKRGIHTRLTVPDSGSEDDSEAVWLENEGTAM